MFKFETLVEVMSQEKTVKLVLKPLIKWRIIISQQVFDMCERGWTTYDATGWNKQLLTIVLVFS